jgi:hypothetical protein
MSKIDAQPVMNLGKFQNGFIFTRTSATGMDRHGMKIILLVGFLGV